MFCLAISTIELFCHLMIAVPIVFVVLVGMTILTISLLKMYGWKLRKDKAAAEMHDRKFRPDGQPYPDTGRGMCQSCKQVLEDIYYMPSGDRLCRDCYHQMELTETPCQKEPPAEETA